MNVLAMPTASRRRTRSPENDFHIRQRAFVIQPFMFHPVRAGETLKSLLWQTRVVTDPIRNPLIGWHLEYYYFYVQLDDIVAPGTEDTALAPLWDYSLSFNTTIGANSTRLEMGSVTGGAELSYNAYRRIVEEYFREHGEVWNTAHKMSGALALARRPRLDATESYGTTTNYGYNDVTINIADSSLTVNEIISAMSQYAMLMDSSVGAVTTFEDYLASQGQGRYSDNSRAYRPELLRYIKEWSYPVNTVEPTTGVPMSAVSWAVSGRADKDRYFKQNGFVVGLCVVRPKTYRKTNDHYADGLGKGAQWIPKQSLNDPNAGWAGTPGAYTDRRDLFEYGWQFVNWDAAASTTYYANNIEWTDLSGATSVAGVYPVETSMNTVFWTASANNTIRSDGRVSMNILTDLPKDMNVGAGASADASATAGVEAEAPAFSSMAELAAEYLAKLRERKAGKDVKLPNIRAALEKLGMAV